MSISYHKYLKIIAYLVGGIIAIPIVYLLISVVLSLVIQNKIPQGEHTVFLSTNGVHADFIFPINLLESSMLNELKVDSNTEYVAIGWGDKNFYINTPNWSDLTLTNAFSAAFLKSDCLLHITRYHSKQKDWIPLNLSREQLMKLNTYVHTTFKKSESEHLKILKGKGYSFNDDFFEAHGSYSCLKTCNTWVNSGLKISGLPCCYWTPFDFSILRLYRKK